jgi:hypothetical protein
MIQLRAFALLAFIIGSVPSLASGQVNEPLGGFVVDARGVWARFGEDAVVAGIVGVTPVNLPTRGLGIAVGAHWYPVRLKAITVGLGAEFMTARGERTLEIEGDDDDDPDEEPDPTPVVRPTVSTRLTSLSPQLSLNFGRKNGWSYISGGIGVGNFTAETVDLPAGEPAGRPRVFHYGGGARWFTKKHLAISVDLRFYTINEQPPAIGRPAFPRTRVMVISAGVGLR